VDWKRQSEQQKAIVSADNHDSTLIQKYGLIKKDNKLYANAFLWLVEGHDPTELTQFGFLQGRRAGQMITGLIPVENMEYISGSEVVRYVQIGEPATITMDSAKISTWVNEVHKGDSQPQAYLGKDVIVGIIDGGFDYAHPNFYDTSGSVYRVKRVWDQNATSGTPPSGFSYGKELSTQTDILNAQYSDKTGSHGTHVAGIAGGSGSFESAIQPFGGVAPMCDLVFVATKKTTTSVADGIAYIMEYAESVNKPCVIKMSLGTQEGPHDGTSFFDQYCDSMVGPGKLLVGSAGNTGNDNIYIGKSYASSDSIYTLLRFPRASPVTKGKTIVDIWGTQGNDFQVVVAIYNANTDSFEDATPDMPANSNNYQSYTLHDMDASSPDICYVEISTEINPLNNKPHVRIDIDNRSQDDSYRWILLKVKAISGQTNMWAVSENVEFTSNGKSILPWVSGTTTSTVGEIGGTGNSVISVGAYTSKNSWTALNGNNKTSNAILGDIAPFSANGPVMDGRTKPDITAPGNVIVSSLNHYDTDYSQFADEVVGSVYKSGTLWYYGTMQGTSMSAPVVAGILALWLEARPDLTPSRVKEVLKATSTTDSYTGTIPANGSNVWGWGKINALAGLQYMLNPPLVPIITADTNAFCQGDSTTLRAPSGYVDYLWSSGQTTQIITVSASGDYAVKVQNDKGVWSLWSAEKKISVYANPDVPVISVNGNVLTSSASSGNQWYFNSTVITGATQRTYTARQTGNYAVEVSNAANCSSRSEEVLVSPTGIVETEKTAVTTIYPNPTTGAINIRFSDNQTNVLLQLYDMKGLLLKEYRVESAVRGQIETLCPDKLENGVYILRISTLKSSTCHKITLIR
jgi:subtilisin family serine protease